MVACGGGEPVAVGCAVRTMAPTETLAMAINPRALPWAGMLDPIGVGSQDNVEWGTRPRRSTRKEQFSRQGAKRALVFQCVIGVARFTRRVIRMLELPDGISWRAWRLGVSNCLI